MKKIITILLCITISVALVGQSSQGRIQNDEYLMNFKDIEYFRGGNTDEYLPIHQTNNQQSNLLKSSQGTKQCLDSLIRESWNIDMNQWVALNKSEYSYDDNGNISLAHYYTWEDSCSLWIPINRSEYSFNSSGDEIYYVSYSWIDNINQWIADYKIESSYDTIGNLILTSGFGWVDSTSIWVLSFIVEYTYDANWNLLLSTAKRWNDSTSQWIPFDKSEYTYDNNGNRLTEIRTVWLEVINDWMPFTKDEYFYNQYGIRISYILYFWSYSSQWKASSKGESSYDNNGNPELDLFFQWDENISQWITSSKREFTHNLSYSLSQLLLPPLSWLSGVNSEYTINMPVDFKRYLFVDNDWNINEKGTYYYSEVIVGNPEYSNLGFNIFPNPAKQKISISFDEGSEVEEVSIYNLAGQRDIHEREPGNEVDVSRLIPGMYIVEVTVEGRKIRQKLLVQR